jgi:hypothetical protein
MRRQQESPEVNPATIEPELRTDGSPPGRPRLRRGRDLVFEEAAVDPRSGQYEPCPDEEVSAIKRQLDPAAA